MKKLTRKKGFTLAEMLIVIAIIAILIAIAIPTFSAQLEGARIAVDMSNARAASSLAYSEYMLYHTGGAKAAGPITYTFGTDSEENLFILSHRTGEQTLEDNKSDADGSEIAARSARVGDTSLTVTVDDGKITENTWLALLKES